MSQLMDCRKQHVADDKLEEGPPVAFRKAREVTVARKKLGLFVDPGLEGLLRLEGRRARRNSLRAKRLRQQGCSAQSHEHHEGTGDGPNCCRHANCSRSEEHTPELQSR